jgi:hypothetical protein
MRKQAVTQEMYDEVQRKKAKEAENEARAYYEYRTRVLAQSPYMRAQNLNLFKLVYQAFTGQIVPPADMREEAIKIQEAFFIKNPKRIYCDPALFRELIGGDGANRALLTLVETVIGQDMYYAK